MVLNYHRFRLFPRHTSPKGASESAQSASPGFLILMQCVLTQGRALKERRKRFEIMIGMQAVL